MMVHAGVDALTHGHAHAHAHTHGACSSNAGDVSPQISCAAQSRKTARRDSKSLWSSLFSSSPKKTRRGSSDKTSAQSEDMTQFVHQLTSEGRSAENISVHLSHLRDVDVADQTQVEEKKKVKKENSFVKLVKSLQSALREEIQEQQMYMYAPPAESRFLTVSISVAPFWGAPPPDRDMTFEEMATLEPIYTGNQCINLLPVTKYDGTPLPGDQTTCAICLGDFEQKEELKSLHCVHFYHKECIDRWLMVGHNCPVCKSLVL